MKPVHTSPGKLLVLISAMGISVAFAAPAKHTETTAPVASAAPSATAVYQRQSNTDSIELSNIPTEGALRLPISVDANVTSAPAASEAKSAVADAASTTRAKVKKKVLKKIKKADGTEEEVWVDSEEDADSADGTDTAATDSGAGESRNSDGTLNSGGGYSGGGYLSGATQGGSVGSGSTTGSSGGNTSTSNTSTGTGTTTSTGTNTSTGTGTGTNTTASTGTSTGSTVSVGTDGIPVDSSLPTPQTALETKLNNYRTMMLTEVLSTATVTNPAAARRYQKMDRSTFQSLLGY